VKPVYPWSAVVGQSALKQALLLCALDPAIGGVLVQGPRGVAKTTLARALGQLVRGVFVELPLGASEERVTGSLDLESVLRDGKVSFSPGLLARAHEGVLYVDEVNLLPDALVDLLLDAAASGQNSVERDGVSHVHAARFVLVGTMNPEEGELRPQLTDRFGLSVEAEGDIPPSERAQIVARRLAFDDDAVAFVSQFATAQTDLIARCRRARERAAAIPLGGPALERVSELCYAAGVEGVRADLAMLRAARAHAAWHEREAITADDVDAVAELALAHRRREPLKSGPRGGGAAPPSGRSPSAGSPGSGQASRDMREAGPREPSDESTTGAPSELAPNAPARGESDSTAPAQSGNERAAQSGRTDAGSASSSTAGRGALAALPVRAASALARLPVWLTAPDGPRSEARKRGAGRHHAPRGRAGARGNDSAGSVDWPGTLTAAAHARAVRSGGACLRPASGELRLLTLLRTDLRYRVRRAPHMQLWVVALDCSASMLRSGALAAAKAAVQALESSALKHGSHLALLSFSGSSAQLQAGLGAARATRQRALHDLGGSGGTPLRAALHEAHTLCTSRRFHAADITKRIFLLTDGRTRESFGDGAGKDSRAEVVVIDCERGAVRLRRAEGIAGELGGRYLHVDELS